MTAPKTAALRGIIDPFPSATPALPAGVTYAQIRNRWERLLPRLRLRRLSITDLACLDHRREVLALLHEGIPWRAIMRLNLDDPTVHVSDRLWQRERYLERAGRAKIRKPRGPNRPKEPPTDAH